MEFEDVVRKLRDRFKERDYFYFDFDDCFLRVSIEVKEDIKDELEDLLKVEAGQSMDDSELKPEIKELATKLKLNESFLERNVNLGFSGGEVKRSEILQLLTQQPDFIMFDEPDSGVDKARLKLV